MSTTRDPASTGAEPGHAGAMRALDGPPAVAPDVTAADADGGQRALPLIAQKWLTSGRVETTRPTLPISWPEPVTTSSRELEVTLHTEVPPAFVEVAIWDKDVAASGAPVGDPVHVVKFSRSPNPGHRPLTAQGGVVPVMLALPPARVLHVALWASWPVPEKDWRRQGLARAPGDDHATWWAVARAGDWMLGSE